MDRSKLFDVPLDSRRSNSPMLDPLWSDVMDEIHRSMQQIETIIEEQEFLQAQVKGLHEKLRELYRTNAFRRHEQSRRSLQVPNNSFSSRIAPSSSEILTVTEIPSKKPRFWSCFHPDVKHQ